MYLQCPTKTSRTARILFYALCLLYFLSTVNVITDLVALILEVSNNSICKNLTFFYISAVQSRIRTLSTQGQIDSEPTLFQLVAIQTTASGCCDFLAQCILVRLNHCTVTYHPFYSHKSCKDLSMLDRVGSQHPCRDHSFNLGNHILRSVDLSS